MASYFGVEDGNTSSGYLIANGNVYPAVSGAGTLSDIPAGSYKYSAGVPIPENLAGSMTDGSNRGNFSFFLIVGTAKEGGIPDPRGWTTQDGVVHPTSPDDARNAIGLHFDGHLDGTAGCIGYQDPAARDALIADPDKSVNVQYLDSDDAVKRAVELRLGHLVDWKKVKALHKPASSGSGAQSKTTKGKKVENGQPDVLIGPKVRQAAHQQAPLEGGGMVAEGNPTVLVGSAQYPLSRVRHMTTDGSPLADGEASVLLS